MVILLTLFDGSFLLEVGSKWISELNWLSEAVLDTNIVIGSDVDGMAIKVLIIEGYK